MNLEAVQSWFSALLLPGGIFGGLGVALWRLWVYHDRTLVADLKAARDLIVETKADAAREVAAAEKRAADAETGERAADARADTERALRIAAQEREATLGVQVAGLSQEVKELREHVTRLTNEVGRLNGVAPANPPAPAPAAAPASSGSGAAS